MSTNRLGAALFAALLVVSAALAGVTPAAAAGGSGSSGDLFAPSVTEDTSWIGRWTPSDDVVLYGAESHPGWVVEYKAGHGKDLEAWANASTSRTVRARNNDSNIMIVSAPTSAVGLGYWSFGNDELRDLSYVKRIGVNRRMGVDPITATEIRDSDAWEAPRGSFLATYGGLSGTFEADGAAWSSEINESSLQDTREDVEADRVDVDGTGTRVAVLDTGILYNQSLYGDRVVAAYDAIGDNRVNITDPANVTADDLDPVRDGSSSRHGSWVTTAIAGNGSHENATGIAPGAEIVPIKVLGDDGSGSTDAIARGLEFACHEANADVVSMSLGSPVPSMEINKEISSCLEETDVSAIVVAAGNNRMTYRYVASPADANEPIVTVAATDGRQINESESAYFSAVGPDPSTGAGVDVAAPGMAITAWTGDRQTTLSGTSMAAPVVSGVSLLTLEANPSLSGQPVELADRLSSSAEAMPEAGVTEVGAGRVNAHNAVNGVTPETAQRDALNTEAKARDGGNEALAGSIWRGIIE